MSFQIYNKQKNKWYNNKKWVKAMNISRMANAGIKLAVACGEELQLCAELEQNKSAQ